MLQAALSDCLFLDLLPFPDNGFVSPKIDVCRCDVVQTLMVAFVEAFFKNHPTEARTALANIPDASQLLGKLLDGGHTRAAGRLARAFRSIGSEKIADEILSAMRAASHDVREVNPFEKSIAVPNAGRVARFLMNVMMAAAGQPWTVIRVEERNEYMRAMEAASVQGNIIPFASFLAKAGATK